MQAQKHPEIHMGALTTLRHAEDDRAPEEEANQQSERPGEKALADAHEESAAIVKRISH